MTTAATLTGIPTPDLAGWVRSGGNPPRVPMDAITRRHRGHFFDGPAMHFFGSRLAQTGYALPNGGAVFVTSEQNRGTYPSISDPRRYSVRVQLPAGDIAPTPYRRAQTVSYGSRDREYMPALDFQAHPNGRAADKAARAYALTCWRKPEHWAPYIRDMAEDGWRLADVAGVFGISYQKAAAIRDRGPTV